MIKLMSFNIRYGLANDGENRWERRKPLVAARIQTFNPDLLGLQECRDDEQAEFIQNSLPGYHFIGVPREGGGETALEMAPILFRTSTFEFIRQGCFWLSETPQTPGSKSWDSTFARTATWAELTHRPTGKTLVFLNTHFDYQPVAIEESARLLSRWVEQTAQQHPVILTGDFNADKSSSAYRLLTATTPLCDIYRQAHPGGVNDVTFHGFGQPGAEATIDWLLCSNHFEVVSAEIDHYHQGSLWPSDHYPVTAVLK